MTDKRKADLFDALFSRMQRIRMIGCGQIGTFGLQHIGLELWDKYPDPREDVDSRETFLTMIETIADASTYECTCTEVYRRDNVVCSGCLARLDKHTLVKALLRTQSALAAHRDGGKIECDSLEEFKYRVVDAALQTVQEDD